MQPAGGLLIDTHQRRTSRSDGSYSPATPSTCRGMPLELLADISFAAAKDYPAGGDFAGPV